MDNRPSPKVKVTGWAAAGAGVDDGGVPAGAGGWLEAAGAAAEGLPAAEVALADGALVLGALAAADWGASAVLAPPPAEALDMQPVRTRAAITATGRSKFTRRAEYMLLPFKRTP